MNNQTYQLGLHTVLLFNTQSTDPKSDGWWLDGPTERRPRRIDPSYASHLLDLSSQLGTLKQI